MADAKPFLPTEAKDFTTDLGDFLLPICMPRFNVMMGEDLAIVVFETVEGQRVGVPLGMQAISDLREALGEAVRSLQASEGGSVQ